MVQYNFKIDEELKAKLEKALRESNADNKSDFLEQLVSAYTIHQSSAVNADIDLSKYENVNTQTKEAMNNAFKHILTTLDSNFSTTKQEAIYLDAERKELAEKAESHAIEILKLKSDTSAEIEAIKAKANELATFAKENEEKLISELKVLETTNKELEEKYLTTSKVADQVQVVIIENKELRESMRTGEAISKAKEAELLEQLKNTTSELTSAKETTFKSEIESKNKDTQIKALKAELAQLTKTNKENTSTLKAEYKAELTALNDALVVTRSDLNRSIGKLEILEKAD